MRIRKVRPTDCEAVAEIYNHYIANSVVTFEEDLVDGAEMAERVSETEAHGLPWYIGEDGEGTVLGYAYASKWKGRCAYRHSVEVTVYLKPDQVGRGAGTKLYTALFDQLRAQNVHVVIGGISLPNDASVGLHEKFGMEKVAHFREVGFKFDRWIDVGYWQGFLNDDHSL